MISTTLAMVIAGVPAAVLVLCLVCMIVVNIRLKNTNTLLWEQYTLVKENREEEVDLLHTELQELTSRIESSLTIINENKELMTGTRIALVTLLKRGVQPS